MGRPITTLDNVATAYSRHDIELSDYLQNLDDEELETLLDDLVHIQKEVLKQR